MGLLGMGLLVAPGIASIEATLAINPKVIKTVGIARGFGPDEDFLPGCRTGRGTSERRDRRKLGEPEKEERAARHGEDEENQCLVVSMLVTTGGRGHGILVERQLLPPCQPLQRDYLILSIGPWQTEKSRFCEKILRSSAKTGDGRMRSYQTMHFSAS